MTEQDIAVLLRDTMLIAAMLAGPPLLAGMIVGLLISLLQAVTQINEATLAFVPKVIAIVAAFLFAGSFMFTRLAEFTQALFARLIEAGGA